MTRGVIQVCLKVVASVATGVRAAIVFAGKRFDVMSVRRWRETVLGGKTG